MESIDKLREWAQNDNTLIPCNKVRELADEIEREIAERYMLLPVDADGVPIRVGDEVVMNVDNKKTSVQFVAPNCFMQTSPVVYHMGAGCRHVKPRTLEDVLKDYALEMNMTYNNGEIGGEERSDALDALTAKYADELRQMGVEE